jgi:hypothetical protein
VHENNVDREAMQPSGKCGLSAKACDLAKELEEGFLSEVFRNLNIVNHAERERVDPSFVKPVKKLEALTVALLGTFNGFGF